jgi:hypothetical protein
VIFEERNSSKNILIYKFNTKKNRKLTDNFLLLQKLAKIGYIYHKIWGYFSPESVHTNENEEKFSRS